MNRKWFWFGYLLAIGVMAWIIWRQRQEEVEATLERLRKASPLGMDWPGQERAARVAEERVIKTPSPPPAAATLDDLQQISGIGPTYARRLNEAGVTSFGELAALTPDEIRQRMDLPPWQGNVESWIEQAKSLSF
jgi:large subunit ribosomal protein L21